MATIHDVEYHLENFEFAFKDFKQKFQSKQSERLFSSHVWMAEKLEEKVGGQLKPLKDGLVKLRAVYEQRDYRLWLELSKAVNLCEEIRKLVGEIIALYNQKAGFLGIKLRWTSNIPAIEQRLVHLKQKVHVVKLGVAPGPGKQSFVGGFGSSSSAGEEREPELPPIPEPSEEEREEREVVF